MFYYLISASCYLIKGYVCDRAFRVAYSIIDKTLPTAFVVKGRYFKQQFLN